MAPSEDEEDMEDYQQFGIAGSAYADLPIINVTQKSEIDCPEMPSQDCHFQLPFSEASNNRNDIVCSSNYLVGSSTFNVELNSVCQPPNPGEIYFSSDPSRSFVTEVSAFNNIGDSLAEPNYRLVKRGSMDIKEEDIDYFSSNAEVTYEIVSGGGGEGNEIENENLNETENYSENITDNDVKNLSETANKVSVSITNPETGNKNSIIKPKKGFASIKSSRRFPCPHCDLILTSRPNREKHIRIHTGERPFTCERCGVGKVTRSDLHRHMMIHTKIREHFCGECSKGYYSFNTVRRHIMNIHKKDPDDVSLYRIMKFKQEGTNEDMMKIKVVKNKVNYNRVFKIVTPEDRNNLELEAAVQSLATACPGQTVTFSC